MSTYSPNYTLENIETFFSYHPPKTTARRDAHTAINEGAVVYAKTILTHVKDPRFVQLAINMLQQVRMFANQGITTAELLAEGRLIPGSERQPYQLKAQDHSAIVAEDFPLGDACSTNPSECEACQ